MKSKEPSKSNEYGKEPNSLLYFIAYHIFKLLIRKFRIQIDKKGVADLKPPFIALGNHPSYLDPFIMGYALYPQRINYLGTNYYFRNKYLKPFIKAAGVIPKIQFYRDARAVRLMSKVIVRGGVLGIFPEGHRSVDGKQANFADGIAKLIKLYNVPVAALVSNGAYLTWPRWSGHSRKGLIETTLKIILMPDEIKQLSVTEIMEKVRSSLNYDDYKWNTEKGISFRHTNAAEKIDLVLHECPKCGNEKSMSSEGTALFCRECGNKAIMNDYGFLIPATEGSVIFPDTVKWFEWQEQRMLTRMRNSDYEIVSKVIELRTTDTLTEPFVKVGEGELRLNNRGLTFKGRIKGEQEEIFYPPQAIESINPEFGVNFEITNGKTSCRFFLEDGQDIIRMDIAISQLQKINR